MAFGGYLIKVGGSNGTILPMKFMKAESYKSTPAQRMESKATRDATGVLHRTTVEHTATKIEFETPVITNRDVVELMTLFRANWTNELERRLDIYYYNEEEDDYILADVYMPDIQFPINRIDLNTNTVYYNSIRFAFIEY